MFSLAKKINIHLFNSIRNYHGLTGGQIIYRKLLDNNVKDAFIYSGGAVMPIIDAFYKGSINYFVNSHEQSCGHAATGYAKTTNQTGVAIVTSGPGLTNMLTPILDANNDSTPLIVLSGQVPRKAIGTDAFQEAPAVELTKPATKWSYQIQNIEEIPRVLDKAFFIANDKKKGAVHIDIPKDISSSYLDREYESFIPPKDEKVNINESELKLAAKIINKSKKPVLYIGQGCNNCYQLVRLLASKGNIPVSTTIHANGVYDERDSLSLRWCGMHGSPISNYSIQESDCIIAIGSRFDDRTTGELEKYAPKAIEAGRNKTGGIIHVNIEESEINKVLNTDYNFNCDASYFINKILPYIEFNKRTEWLKIIKDRKEKYPFTYTESDDSNLNLEKVLEVMNKKTINRDCIFTTGVGNHQMQTYQYIYSKFPKKIISSGSLGVMGAGLPYAIGAQIANPNKLVIDVDGDSSFNMTMNELKTISQYNLPIKIAIMNNSAQMMVTTWERLFFNERYTATIYDSNPSYVDLAKSFKINSIKCDNNDNLEDKIEEFINSDGPMLCEFKIKRDMCLPLVAPGKALDEMILNNENTKLSGMAPS